MRSIFTILTVLFALSASAQNIKPQTVATENVVAVAAEQVAVAQDSTAVAPPEAAKVDTLKVAAGEPEDNQPLEPATVTVQMHGDAGDILNGRIYSSSKKIKGYRIMLFSDSSPNARGEASSARARFTKLFQKLPVYMFYDNPNFKVTAGNFRTRDDAEEKLERIRKHFPNAFIVQVDISVLEFAK